MTCSISWPIDNVWICSDLLELKLGCCLGNCEEELRLWSLLPTSHIRVSHDIRWRPSSSFSHLLSAAPSQLQHRSLEIDGRQISSPPGGGGPPWIYSPLFAFGFKNLGWLCCNSDACVFESQIGNASDITSWQVWHVVLVLSRERGLGAVVSPLLGLAAPPAATAAPPLLSLVVAAALPNLPR
jgi:hypothetical protein